MAKWRKQTVKLKKNHGWRGKPGYYALVMDRGDAGRMRPLWDEALSSLEVGWFDPTQCPVIH
jgi:hypothetical protein